MKYKHNGNTKNNENTILEINYLYVYSMYNPLFLHSNFIFMKK